MVDNGIGHFMTNNEDLRINEELRLCRLYRDVDDGDVHIDAEEIFFGCSAADPIPLDQTKDLATSLPPLLLAPPLARLALLG